MPEAPAPGPLLQSGYHACHQTGYEVASLTDLLPTIAEATGANVPSDWTLMFTVSRGDCLERLSQEISPIFTIHSIFFRRLEKAHGN
jgi:hypothetical protein